MKSFLQHFKDKVDDDPNACCVSFVDSSSIVTKSFTRIQLWNASKNMAYILATKYNIKKGQRCMIVYPFGIDFLVGFLACMHIGAIVVSVYPPNPKNLQTDLPKFKHFVEDCGATIVLTTKMYKRVKRMSQLKHKWPKGLEWVVTDTVTYDSTTYPENWEGFMHDFDLQSLAFLQYTSGSTNKPKGVMISHGALSHEIDFLFSFAENIENLTLCSWLPQYHDLGLILAYLAPICFGAPIVNMSPLDFLKQPLLWMKVIEKYDITLSVAAPFGLDLCVRRAIASNKTFDCSTLKVIAIGGESPKFNASIDVDLKRLFKFDTSILSNGYGMAESTLAIIGPLQPLQENGMWSCGNINRSKRGWDIDIRIVNPDSCVEVQPGELGEVWVNSKMNALGYWNKPELTKETFQAHLGSLDKAFLRTGDQAYVNNNGDMFVVARLKDVIILQGKNYSPLDLEHAAQASSPKELRPGCTAAFQVDAKREDKVVIVSEVRRGVKLNKDEMVELTSRIKRAVQLETGALVSNVVLIPQTTIPKTTSGKLQRRKCKSFYLEGKLTTLNQDVDSQVESVDLESATCLQDVFDALGIDSQDRSLSESGVTSLEMSQIHSISENKFGIHFSYQELSTLSVGELLSKSLTKSEKSIPTIKLPGSPPAENTEVNRHRFGTQFVIILKQLIVLSVVFSAVGISTYPSVQYISHFAENDTLWFRNGRMGVLYLLVIPFWMLTYTIVCIVLKWIILGVGFKNQSSRTLVIQKHWNIAFMRWWTVERLFAVWEAFVGGFLLDTPFLNLVYMSVGLKTSLNVRFKTFIRDWDFINIGSGSEIGGYICPRLFRQGKVYFDTISIGYGVTTSSQTCVQLGTEIADGVEIKTKSWIKPYSKLVKEDTAYEGVPYDQVEWNDSSSTSSFAARLVSFTYRLLVPFIFCVMAFGFTYLANEIVPAIPIETQQEIFTVQSIFVMVSNMMVFQLTGIFCFFTLLVMKWTFVAPDLTDRLAGMTFSVFFVYAHKNILGVWWHRAFGMKLGDTFSGIGLLQSAVSPSKAHFVTLGKRSFFGVTSFDPELDNKENAQTIWKFLQCKGLKSPWNYSKDSKGAIHLPDDFEALNHTCIESGVQYDDGAVGTGPNSCVKSGTTIKNGIRVMGSPATTELYQQQQGNFNRSTNYMMLLLLHTLLTLLRMCVDAFIVYTVGETIRKMLEYRYISWSAEFASFVSLIVALAMLSLLLAMHSTLAKWFLLGSNGKERAFAMRSVHSILTIHVQSVRAILYENFQVLFAGTFMFNLLAKLNGNKVGLTNCFLNQIVWIDPTDGNRIQLGNGSVIDNFVSVSAHQTSNGQLKLILANVKDGSVLHPFSLLQGGTLGSRSEFYPYSTFLHVDEKGDDTIWTGLPTEKTRYQTPTEVRNEKESVKGESESVHIVVA